MGSVRRRSGKVRVGLDDPEVVLLASLMSQVRQILGGDNVAADEDPMEALLAMPPSEVEAPDDPVLARLLPNAYRDDDAAAGEFRRLMDGDLRREKCAALQRVVDDVTHGGTRKGDELRLLLEEDAAAQWLYALTDVRLVLGTLLGVTEEAEERESVAPGSPADLQFNIYDWVTWLQDGIVRALTD